MSATRPASPWTSAFGLAASATSCRCAKSCTITSGQGSVHCRPAAGRSSESVFGWRESRLWSCEMASDRTAGVSSKQREDAKRMASAGCPASHHHAGVMP